MPKQNGSHKIGLAQSSEIEAQKLRGGFLQKLGNIAIRQGEFEQAQVYLEQTHAIAMTIGSLPSLTNVRRDLARLAIAQGDYAHARQMLEECIVSLEESGYHGWVTRVLPALAAVYHLLGEDTQAEHHYQRAMQLAGAGGNRVSMARCLTGLGRIAVDQGDSARAGKWLQEALALWTALGLESEIAVVYALLGRAQALAGAPDAGKATAYYTKALELARQQGLAPLALDVFVGMARLLAARGEDQRAVDLLMLAAYHPAATAETKRMARSESKRMAAMAYSPDPLPDWRLVAQNLMEELVV